MTTVLHRLPSRAPAATDALARRATILWPDAPALQAKWVRAVLLVRSTRRGWLIDNHVRPSSRHA